MNKRRVFHVFQVLTILSLREDFASPVKCKIRNVQSVYLADKHVILDPGSKERISLIIQIHGIFF